MDDINWAVAAAFVMALGASMILGEMARSLRRLIDLAERRERRLADHTRLLEMQLARLERIELATEPSREPLGLD